MTEKSKIALQLTQSKGICEMLISLVPLNELEQHYLELSKQDNVADVRKAISKLPKYKLQQLIEMSNRITDQDIMTYRDEYPNGSRPSFTLYSASKFIGQDIPMNKLVQDVKLYLNNIEKQEQELLGRGYDSPGIKKIVLLETEKKSAGVELYELNLRFARRHDYEDENGEPCVVYEAAYCFVWISLDKGFVATHNTPSKVEKTLKNMFDELYGVSMRQYSFNDEVLGLICDLENIKSASFVNLSKDDKIPDKVRYSDSDLNVKMKELKHGTQEYTNSLFNEDLIDKDGNVHTVTLGVNSKAGKVHIKQNLSHSMFLETSIGKISEIIQYFSLDTGEGISRKIQGLSLFTSGSFARACSEKRDILYKIAAAIKVCKDNEESETFFDAAPMDVYKYFCNDINIQYFFQCKSCDDLEIAHCPECKRSDLKINKDTNKIHCNLCRKDITYYECDEGHTGYISDVNNIIHLALTENLSAKIVNELQSFSPELRFDNSEVIVISCGKLRIMKNSNYNMVNLRDINEFNSICSTGFNENQISDAELVLSKINEKCNDSKKEKCKTCRRKKLTDINQVECLMQLFTYFIDYIPSPHHGHEYGDININITYKGANCNLQGIMKSKGALTEKNSLGREILQQGIYSLRDTRVDITAIITPDIIPEGLRQTLNEQARFFNSKIVFLEDDFMIKLYLSFAKQLDEFKI